MPDETRSKRAWERYVCEKCGYEARAIPGYALDEHFVKPERFWCGPMRLADEDEEES